MTPAPTSSDDATREPWLFRADRHLQLLALVILFGAAAAYATLVDWRQLAPRAAPALLAILVTGSTLLVASAVLRERRSIGADQLAFPSIVVAALLVPIASLSGGMFSTWAWCAAAMAITFGVLATGGRRPYEGALRLEGLAVAYAIAVVVVIAGGLEPAIGELTFGKLCGLTVAHFAFSVSLGLAAAQSWRPTRGVLLLISGATGFAASRIIAADGAPSASAEVLAAVSVLVLLVGARVGDPGLPTAAARRRTLAVVGLAAATGAAVLVAYGQEQDQVGPLAASMALIVLSAIFGRALVPISRAPSTDPSQVGGVDRLTGLANRHELELTLEREMLYASARRTPVALAVMHVDNLDEVNETLGHRVGDEVLREFANRLGARTGADVPARLAGDSFALALRAHASERDARVALEGLLERIAAPLQVDGVSLTVSVRCGLAFFPAHGRRVPELLQRAEVAAQEARARRTPLCIYDPAREIASRERLQFAAELRDGLQRDEIVVHFQPKVDLGTGVVVGAEALVRWRHPTAGLLNPQRFLRVAERTGLMHGLTDVVLVEALRQAQQWRSRGFDLDVAVNLSPGNLSDARLPDRLLAHLRRFDLPGRALRLEVTEDAAMADPERAALVIGQIKASGIAVALDDFGTGYSSMAHLKHLGADELKIDRSFIREMARNADDRVIVAAILDLARNLGMRSVAEGIESPEVVEALASMGCTVGQGFHFARPLSGEAFLVWCEERRRDGGVRMLGGQARLRAAAPPTAPRPTPRRRSTDLEGPPVEWPAERETPKQDAYDLHVDDDGAAADLQIRGARSAD